MKGVRYKQFAWFFSSAIVLRQGLSTGFVADSNGSYSSLGEWDPELRLHLLPWLLQESTVLELGGREQKLANTNQPSQPVHWLLSASSTWKLSGMCSHTA